LLGALLPVGSCEKSPTGSPRRDATPVPEPDYLLEAFHALQIKQGALWAVLPALLLFDFDGLGLGGHSIT